MTEPSATAPVPRVSRSGWQGAWLCLVPFLFAFGVAHRVPALLIDDAYITFRYAENLVRGHGLVFNPGERVLGTTAALWAGMLAGARELGADIPTAALWFGQLFSALSCALLTWILFRRVSPALAVMAGMALALHPDFIFFANSGMETGLSMALVLAGLELALRRRFFLAGMLGALCFLTRPDGGLVLMLAGILALSQGLKSSVRLALPVAVLILPWLIFATLEYGSPLPQSVAAKQLITVAAPLNLLSGYVFLLLPVWPMQILAFLGVPSGALALLRRTESWPYAVWSVLYLGGLAFSRIEPIFPWYITPLLPALFLFAAISLQGLSELVRERAPRGGRWVAGAAPVLVLAGLGLWTFSFGGFYRDVRESQFGRARDYLRIGDWLSREARPGDRIMVAEVGVLGYELMDFPVIDNSGINSEEVLRIRRAYWEQRRGQGLRGEASDLEQEFVRHFRPEWIVTWYRFMNIGRLTQDPGFRRRYQRVFPPLAGEDEFVVLKRREGP